jgi:lysophospholipase L1-like esterase
MESYHLKKMQLVSCFMIALFAFLTSAIAGNYKHDPTTTEECRVRDGLPGFFKKVRSKTEVRIAYFGGSITAARGWRVKTLSWLKNQFPETQFTELNATISGTGSGYGACRVGTDILPFKPDLVFIEFRVNGGEGVGQQSVEGIVRQIKAANPKTDICFVYTISEGMRDAVRGGKNPPFGQVMEQVANHYGIPSIDLGVEVMKREQAGTLLFKGNVAENGVLLFTKDGTHPTDGGHNLYTEVIIRSLLKMETTALRSNKSRMKPQLFENPFEKGVLIPVESVSKSAGWKLVDVLKDPVYTRDKFRTDRMLRGAYKCSTAGESMIVSYEGTAFGINDITQGKPVVIEIVLDGDSTITLTRPQDSPEYLYARCIFLPQLLNGKHIAELTVKFIPEGGSYYVGQFLQAGPLNSGKSASENKRR